MKLIAILVTGLLITTYFWRASHDIPIVMPSEHQIKEMAGRTNTPTIPLTPLQP